MEHSLLGLAMTNARGNIDSPADLGPQTKVPSPNGRKDGIECCETPGAIPFDEPTVEMKLASASPADLGPQTKVPSPNGRKNGIEYGETPGAMPIDELTTGMKMASLAVIDDKEGTLENVGKREPWHTEVPSPNGRKNGIEYAEAPGAMPIDELTIGMKLASLAIIDDKQGTLENVGKHEPWHVEAIKAITESEEDAHNPLTTILSENFNLKCDSIIDISGFTKPSNAMITKGFIAHNNEMIVLSYGCTTSGHDWLEKFSNTSEWKPDIDVPRGHSGFFTYLPGLSCGENESILPVRAGFYNSFLASSSLLQKHIDPLLALDQSPRKLYVVGHGLGAGIATMAACYFLLQHHWQDLPHKLVHVTAGSPRVCTLGMWDVVYEEMKKLRPSDKATMCRIVNEEDESPAKPPSENDFVHLGNPMYISKDGEIVSTRSSLSDDTEEDDFDEKTKVGPGKIKKNKNDKAEMQKELRILKPYVYLKPLIELFEQESSREKQLKKMSAAERAAVKKRTNKATKKDNRSLHGDLQHLLVDEKLSDISLQGTDGENVKAVKAILAARSQVFKDMFFGENADSNSSSVSLEYSSTTIRAVVHYCYGDVLRSRNNANVKEYARELVRLIEAANFFNLPGLGKMAFEIVCVLMTETPSLACVVFDQVDGSVDTLTGTLEEVAERIIRRKTEAAFMQTEADLGGVSSLNAAKLRHLVEEGSLAIDSLTLFQAIVKWNEAKGRPSKIDTNESSEKTENEETATVAAELVQSIELSTISPSDLTNVVEPTGLVSTSVMLEAFKVHALVAEKEGVLQLKSKSVHSKKDEVIVYGSGVPEANGIYTRDGSKNGAPVYSKLAEWNGKESKFIIDQRESTKDELLWWIHVEKDFFYCAKSGENRKAVPLDSWEEMTKYAGRAPAPMCALVQVKKKL